MEDPPVPKGPILYSPATFGRHDAAVRHVEGLVQTRAPFPGSGRFAASKPGAWGLLHSGDTISAGSGLTLGGGSVTLLARDGSTLVDTGQSVPVYNSGAAISTSSGDKVVALEWTEAGWSACECGPSPTCTPCSIPTTDLTLTMVFAEFGDWEADPVTLVYDPGGPAWEGPLVVRLKATGDLFTLHDFRLVCAPGEHVIGDIVLEYYHGSPEDGCVFSSTSIADEFDPAYTCDPLHLHFIVYNTATSTDYCGPLTDYNMLDIYIDE